MLRDKKSYIKALLKQNFDKYRKGDREISKEAIGRETVQSSAALSEVGKRNVSFAVGSVVAS